MTNIVFVSEGLITGKDLEERNIPEIIHSFSLYDEITFKVAVDTAAMEQEGEMRKANLRLEKEGPGWVRHSPEFLKEIADADIIIMHYSGAGASFFEAAHQLKLLCVMRSGVENVDLQAAENHGVTVCYSPGRAAEPVADFAVTLMLALMRRLPYNNLSRTGRWRAGAPMGSEGMMKGSTVGLLGFGAIAQKVAKRLVGFGCRLIAYDPWARPEAARAYQTELVDSLEELFERSDFLSIHARLTADNHGMVNRSLLERMKPTAYLVNTARAGLICEKDLIEVLQEKRIAGAGLDVFSQEPLPDGHPFLTLDNVIITPHVAGNGGDFILRSIESPLKEIEHYFKKEAYESQIRL